MAFDATISAEIWNAKYRFATAEGGDGDVGHTWARIAEAIALAEPAHAQPLWRDKFLGALTDFRFLPAGASSPAQAPGAPSPCSIAS